MVEHVIGNDGVESPILFSGTNARNPPFVAGFCVGIGGINSIYEQVITNDGGESPASQRRKYSAQDRRRIYEPAACGAIV